MITLKMAGRQAYDSQCAAIQQCDLPHHFSRVIGEHAMHLVQMVEADRLARKKQLLGSWTSLSHVNNKWVGLLCGQDEPAFVNTCVNLVRGYTESIGDYILEGAIHSDRVSKLTKAEGDFYSALKPTVGTNVTRQKWINYTHALVDMVEASNRYGIESDVTWSCAADALVAGRMLGHWLDCAFLHQK